MTRKVARRAQSMANEYVASRPGMVPGTEFDIYTNGRFYTFSVRNFRGHEDARFEHYGRK